MKTSLDKTKHLCKSLTVHYQKIAVLLNSNPNSCNLMRPCFLKLWTSPISLALDGFDLKTVHKLSCKEKKNLG